MPTAGCNQHKITDSCPFEHEYWLTTSAQIGGLTRAGRRLYAKPQQRSPDFW